MFSLSRPGYYFIVILRQSLKYIVDGLVVIFFSCKQTEIKQIVAQVQPINFEEVKKVERKLEHCLNEEYNPESEM